MDTDRAIAGAQEEYQMLEAPKPTPYMLRLMEDDYYLVCDVERRGVMHIVDGRGRVFL